MLKALASVLNLVLSVVSLAVTGTNIHQVAQDRCLFTFLDTFFLNHYSSPKPSCLFSATTFPTKYLLNMSISLHLSPHYCHPLSTRPLGWLLKNVFMFTLSHSQPIPRSGLSMQGYLGPEVFENKGDSLKSNSGQLLLLLGLILDLKSNINS